MEADSEKRFELKKTCMKKVHESKASKPMEFLLLSKKKFCYRKNIFLALLNLKKNN